MNNPARNPAPAPVEKSVTVPWSQEEAFLRFTADINVWWPRTTHSVGQEKVKRVAIDTRIGGHIYEEWDNGEVSEWGTIVAWDPPSVVSFTWHPGRDADTAQRVEVRFQTTSDGTVVELIHDGWETLGEEAAKARANYDTGWDGVLERYTGNA